MMAVERQPMLVALGAMMAVWTVSARVCRQARRARPSAPGQARNVPLEAIALPAIEAD